VLNGSEQAPVADGGVAGPSNRPASDYHAATEAAAAAVATCGRIFFYFDFLIIILEINPMKYFFKKI
jgi:hypothetical protein